MKKRSSAPQKSSPLAQADEIASLRDELEHSSAAVATRLRELDALANIARSLSETERVGLQTVLQLIVASAQELIPAAQKAVIHLWDKEGQTLAVQAVIGYEQSASSQIKMRHNEGVAGQVIASGVTINIADIKKDERFITKGAAPTFRSLMVAPVQSGERRLGTISVQSDETGAFSDEDNRLLSVLGTQAAAAIENARLLETTQRRLKEVEALYRITRELAASLEAGRLMQEAADLLQTSFGYYNVSIFIIEPASGQLVMKQGSGKLGALLKNTRLQAGAGIIGHAAETGAAFLTNNVEDVVFFVPHPLLADTRSELAMPIKVNDRVLGVLDIQQSPPQRLNENDLQLIGTVAEQLAVALQKAELYANLQESLNMEKSMRMQLIQSERLALVGRLLASVSHELNNPLQAIQNALFLLKEDAGLTEQGRQDLQIILSESERMSGLIERLRASYRPTRLDEFQPLSLNLLVEDVHALLAAHLRHKGIVFEFQPEPNLPLISGLPDQMRQVLLNLLMNAVESIPPGGRLSVATQTRAGNEILLSVSDNGPGIAPLLLPRIFDAFVTSKENGTGLGLTITYDIIHRHNGRIEAMNNPQGGATFNVWLPALPTEPA
ncbi:MAG: Adaptive-response sensory-kinase SasA [Anaerolineales bacterium]|nr:Adaptive-response sensory-kinase SasA [Anaerolineales bacterium]